MNIHRLDAIVKLLDICSVLELQKIQEVLDKIWVKKNTEVLAGGEEKRQ